MMNNINFKINIKMEKSLLNSLPKDILIKIIEKDFDEIPIENVLQITKSCLNKIKKEKDYLKSSLEKNYEIENINIKITNHRDIKFTNIPFYLEISNFPNNKYNPVSIWKGRELYKFGNLEDMFVKLAYLLSDYDIDTVNKIVELVEKLSKNITSLEKLHDEIYRIQHFF